MGNAREPFYPETYYHVFNHGNANDNLFLKHENYHFFLKKYAKYISPIAKTYAYCLLPNHFHFFIKIKSEIEIMAYFQETPKKINQIQHNISTFISYQFSHFFNSYSKAFNKVFERKGSLFLDNVNRNCVDNDSYFTKLIHYVHANPVHHGFVNKIEQWEHSSYRSILSEKPTQLQRNEVIAWFGGKEAFILFHQQPIDPKIYP
ncbi:MAG: hypothetical protein U0Y10_08875 [Spirosomataceae bacterium]